MHIKDVAKINFFNSTGKKLKNEITVAEKLNNLRLYKITKTLLMISEGYHFDDIAIVFNVSSRTVYNWFNRFTAEGFSWLCGYHYQGRGVKSRLNKIQKKRLYQIICEGPLKHGFDSGIWNSAMIVIIIEKEFETTYNPRYIPTLLAKIGISYQKAKFEAARLDDEDHKEMRKEWDEKTWPEILKKAHDLNAVILFGDEVSFAQWGSLSKTWGPIGKQPKIKTCGKRKGLKMFGVIEFASGGFEYMECDGRFSGKTYITFLKQLLLTYSCPIILIEDGAPYHTSKMVTDFKEKAKNQYLYCYKLPSYSPDKNPIEKLWRNAKRAATHLKYFKTFEDLRESVLKAFNNFQNDATKVVCVMKKMRFEAGIM